MGTLGGDFSFGNWLDEAGGVVGGATTENNQLFRAFRWINGRMTNLGSLNSNSDVCSIAFNSNSKGQIVGNSLPLCDDDPHPFLWENGGPMIDLNTFVSPGSGILLREAYFINEGGMIAATGRIAGGEDHDRAFVLVPIAEDSDALAGGAQAGAQVAQSAPTVTQVPVSPEAIAAFAARYTHRSRGLQTRAPK